MCTVSHVHTKLRRTCTFHTYIRMYIRNSDVHLTCTYETQTYISHVHTKLRRTSHMYIRNSDVHLTCTYETQTYISHVHTKLRRTSHMYIHTKLRRTSHMYIRTHSLFPYRFRLKVFFLVKKLT